MASRKRVPAAEARAAMKDLVDAVKNRNERIKITRYGKTVAYLVPAKDGEHLELCREEIKPEGGRAARPPARGSRRRAGQPRAK